MLKTVQQLSQIPIKYGYDKVKINRRIITRWAKKGRIKSIKQSNKYVIEEQEFLDYASMHYFRKNINDIKEDI